jgi:hypothetical protein
MSREVTTKILAAVEEGLLDRDAVILACLNYLSEDEVRDMCVINELLVDGDLDDEEE